MKKGKCSICPLPRGYDKVVKGAGRAQHKLLDVNFERGLCCQMILGKGCERKIEQPRKGLQEK